MKIFVITQGEYSDYSIHSMWSTKEKADAMLKVLNLDEYWSARLEEYELDGEVDEKPGVRVVIHFDTGEILERVESPYSNKPKFYPHDDICRTPGVWFQDRTKVLREIPGVSNKKIIDISTIEALHFTLEQALKSARDLRAKKQAEQAGI